MYMKLSAKDALKESLMDLCKKKSIDKITVGQIAENCGFSRKSFYNNFDSKFDLCLYIFKTETDRIIDDYKSSESWASVLGRIYRFMYDNRYLFGKSCNSDDMELLRSGMISFVDQYYLDAFEKLHGADNLTDEFRFLSKYNSYGATNIIIDWIKNDWKESPEEIGALLAEAMPSQLIDET